MSEKLVNFDVIGIGLLKLMDKGVTTEDEVREYLAGVCDMVKADHPLDSTVDHFSCNVYSAALDNAGSWIRSPQGHEYWFNLHSHFNKYL